MVAILFICLVNNKNNAFLYYYKMLNLRQSGFNCLKCDQIKIYCKIFKSKPCGAHIMSEKWITFQMLHLWRQDQITTVPIVGG